ncbi:putative Tyrosinase copper-binding domain-containing protein [Seiridium cardinale]
MSFFHLAILSLAACSIVASYPSIHFRRDIETNCTEVKQRVPWTKLTDEEKSAYVQADLCLIDAPSISGVPGAVSRWDDLQWPHITQTITIHNVGAFLPFHRYYMTVHETLLREECGYTGRIPYWDEVSEVDDMSASSLWGDQYFGSNGEGGDSCIADGQFANLTLRFLSGNQIGDHCVSRQFNQFSFSSAAQSNIDRCNSAKTYAVAWNCWALAPHTAGHRGVGGIMADPTFSPGDPIFFLHHSYLDKLWWEWQKLDYPARLYEMSGLNIPLTMQPGEPNYPPAELTNYFGDNGTTTTLNHNLWMAGVAPNMTIADVMNLNGPTICVEYLNAEDMD